MNTVDCLKNEKCGRDFKVALQRITVRYVLKIAAKVPITNETDVIFKAILALVCKYSGTLNQSAMITGVRTTRLPTGAGGPG